MAKLRDVLVVMNPRRIPECLDAIAALPIPKIYIVNHTERQIAETGFADALDFGYDWYWVVSDDAIVREPALAAVRALAKNHPVVTGYSQRTHTEWTVNLTTGPLHDDHPGTTSYDFYEFQEVVSHPEAALPTWFAGMSLTGMSAEMWETYPFDCYGDPGYASDYSLSWRLQQASVPIVAAREGFAYHWRWDWVTTNDVQDMRPCFDDPRVALVD